MTSGACDDVKQALDMAVVSTIDNVLDRRNAKMVLEGA
jgi:hypothetical protein